MRRLLLMLVALAAFSQTENPEHQYTQRSLIDVCAHLDADLVVDVGSTSITKGHLDLCLCVSEIPALIYANIVLESGVAFVGESTVTSVLTTMINAATGHKTCRFPDHSVPHCTHENVCEFTCANGFTPYPSTSPTDCTCSYPRTICNDECGDFSHCSLQKVKRGGLCPDGRRLCGFWDGERLYYDCVDVSKNLRSCGGCDMPLATDPTGVDCTASAGVDDVACVSGRCVVEHCKDGFDVSSDMSRCIPNTRRKSPHLVNGNGPFTN